MREATVRLAHGLPGRGGLTKNRDGTLQYRPAGTKWPTPTVSSAAHSCFDGRDVYLLHRHHRLERTLRRVAALGHCIGQYARGDLPADAPFVLAPAALAFLPAIADDRVPIAVGLLLIVGRDLEGEGLAVLEMRPAIEADTGYARDGEFDRQGIGRFAAGIIGGRTGGGADAALRKGFCVGARCRVRSAFL